MGMHDSMNYPDDADVLEWGGDGGDMDFANFDDTATNTTKNTKSSRKDRSTKRTTSRNKSMSSLDNAFPDDGELAIEDLFPSNNNNNKWEEQTTATSSSTGSSSSADKMDYFATEESFNKSFQNSTSSLTMRPTEPRGNGTRLARRGRRIQSKHSSCSSLESDFLIKEQEEKQNTQTADDDSGKEKKSKKSGKSKKKKESRRASMPTCSTSNDLAAPKVSSSDAADASVSPKSKNARRKSLDQNLGIGGGDNNNAAGRIDDEMAAKLQKKIAYAKFLREKALTQSSAATTTTTTPLKAAAQPKMEDAMDRIKLAYLANKKKERQGSSKSLEDEEA